MGGRHRSPIVARLVEAGTVSYDEPVATYWPESAANGKESVTVGQMMSHQAAVPYVDRLLGLDEILAVTPVVEALADQAPVWELGTAHGYHALTYGWLAGELVRRVDGRTLGKYFADEVAAPLGLDFWIGLPEAEEPRVSRLQPSPPPTDPNMLALMMSVMGPGTARRWRFPRRVGQSPPRGRRPSWPHAVHCPRVVGPTLGAMALEIVCPQCGTDDDLTGEPVGDGTIRLTCGSCRVQWTRDPRPRCPTCGGDDLYHKPQVIMEKSRGTQMSIQGIHLEYGCHACEPPEVKVRGGRTHHLPDRLDGSQ